MENENINYKDELKKLKENEAAITEFWKAEDGIHSIKVVGEIQPHSFLNKDGVKEESRKLKILVNGVEKIWTFGIGKTSESVYGQLLEIADESSSKVLSGKIIEVKVKFIKNRNHYYLRLVADENQVTEEKIVQ